MNRVGTRSSAKTDLYGHSTVMQFNWARPAGVFQLVWPGFVTGESSRVSKR